MTTLARFEFTAHIGIDWSDTKRPICIEPAGGDKREFDRIAHQPKAIAQRAQSMHRRFGGPIAVALELSKGPLVSTLRRYDFFVLFPVNPSMLAKYRAAFKPSRAKDDPSDAELTVDLVLRTRERFQSAAEVQRYSGIAPVTERSGNTSWVHWRWACPHFVRQTHVEWAEKTVHRSFWAGAYYRQQRSQRGPPATLRCALWPSSGYASCTGAGNHDRRTMNPGTSRRCNAEALTCYHKNLLD